MFPMCEDSEGLQLIGGGTECIRKIQRRWSQGERERWSTSEQRAAASTRQVVTVKLFPIYARFSMTATTRNSGFKHTAKL
jgi:hypothetical protein